MEIKQKAELAKAKKAARADRRQARSKGLDKKNDNLRKKLEEEGDDDEWTKTQYRQD